MLFQNIYGQEQVKQILTRAVQENRIPHALLITGPEGSGKLPLAVAFARYVCCESRGATDACGVCASCVKFDKLIHLRGAEEMYKTGA